jgi:hypothetical protein
VSFLFLTASSLREGPFHPWGSQNFKKYCSTDFEKSEGKILVISGEKQMGNPRKKTSR